MKVTELLDYFTGQKPIVEAAAFLGLHPSTIKNWKVKDGLVPLQWEALFIKKINEGKEY